MLHPFLHHGNLRGPPEGLISWGGWHWGGPRRFPLLHHLNAKPPKSKKTLMPRKAWPPSTTPATKNPSKSLGLARGREATSKTWRFTGKQMTKKDICKKKHSVFNPQKIGEQMFRYYWKMEAPGPPNHPLIFKSFVRKTSQKMAPSTGGRQRHLAAPHAWKFLLIPRSNRTKNIKGKSGMMLTPKTNMDTQNDGLAKADSFKIWRFLVSMIDFWGVIFLILGSFLEN